MSGDGATLETHTGRAPPRRVPECGGPSALVQLLERLCPQGLPVPAPPTPHTHTPTCSHQQHTESEYALGGLALIKGQGRAALALAGPLVESSLPSLSALARNLSNSL